MKHDTHITNARIYIPGEGFSSASQLTISDGLITGIGNNLSGTATETVDAGGNILTSGLIDIHTHIYHKVNVACVDPTWAAKQSGATTLVDAGTAGPSSIEGFVDFIIKPSPIRLLAFLNISYAGIFGFHPLIQVGESERKELLHIGLCVEQADKFRDHVVGIKVRIGEGESGTNGDIALAHALAASDELGLPLMAHIGRPPLDLDTLLESLRPGDILTHCYRGAPNAPLTENTGLARPSVLAARERGVLFDIGHGLGSFSFDTGRRMLDNGFLPDTISSDLHAFNKDGPVKNLLHTASKFLALGMDLETVLDAMTIKPAMALRRPELARLEVGGVADITCLKLAEAPVVFTDSDGTELAANSELRTDALFFGGRRVI